MKTGTNFVPRLRIQGLKALSFSGLRPLGLLWLSPWTTLQASPPYPNIGWRSVLTM